MQMHRHTNTKSRAIGFAVAVTLAVGLSACSNAESSAPAVSVLPIPTQLDIIVSVHANAPAPALPIELKATVDAAITASAPISVIALDGNPEVIYSSGPYKISQVNPTATNDDITAQETALLAAVSSAKADSNGSNLGLAVRVAKDQSTAVNVSNPTIIIIDSGLPDTGTPNLTDPGMTVADPAEVASMVKQRDGLPDLTGSTIELVGFGYTAAPQAQLTGTQLENIAQIWEESFKRMNATTVTVLPVPRSGNGPDTTFTTKTVEVSADPTPNLIEVSLHPLIYGDGSSLGFQPGTADFREAAAAKATLDSIALWLTGSPTHIATIIGTTAGTDTLESQIHLGQLRADAVARELLNRGCTAAQITATGVGTQWPGYVNDVRADGTLDPGIAALNRTTQITLGTR
ncbi:OmpA family protein [Cryobacterium sp. RTC2.1]|uniref:OmpA family protein n=1 Tax=Cryobacterium sp. RTC2.1 TaxID=3048634 RepID=UPI002B236A7A|nr:OmpA family protein [Cryobacterium sp. RTC2.1]MEB0004019.1 OmpA family protein [Cryobacterium sp. RTC2.1]